MIKEILALLPPQQRKQLLYAFEQDLEQLIDCEDGMFLGVNICNTKHLDIVETAGKFIYGKRRK